MHESSNKDKTPNGGPKINEVLNTTNQFLIKIVYGNGRSLGSNPGKLTTLKIAADLENADILIISEAGYVEGGVQHVEDYDIVGNQPKQTKSGSSLAGVAVWIRRNSELKVLYKECISQIDGFQAIEIHTNSGLTIVGFYRSPNQLDADITKTQEYFETLDDNTMIIGDLNIPEANWDNATITSNTKSRDAKENIIETLIDENRRRQIVNFATNKKNENILDIVVIPEQYEAECKITISPEPTKNRAGTDHEWLACTIKNVQRNKIYETNEEGDDTKIVMNYDKVYQFMESYVWKNDPIEWDINSYVHSSDTCIACELIQMCKDARKAGTVQKIKKKNDSNNKTMDKAISTQSQLVRALKNKYLTDPTQYNKDKKTHESKILSEMCNIRAKENAKKFIETLDGDKLAIYRPIRDQTKDKIRSLDNEEGIRVEDPKGVGEILSEYMSEKVFKKSNVKEIRTKVNNKIKTQNAKYEKRKIKMFRIDEKLVEEAIKEIKPTKSTDSGGISNEFILKTRKYLIPIITKIGRLSFNSGIIPECLKQVIVVPIPKKTKANKPNKVRPINLCSNIVKIWERVAKKQIEALLEDKDFFCQSQHGFRNNRSTITCLTEITNKIEELEKEGAHMICLDFAKAFDTVDHEVLIEEMGKAGIEHIAYLWIANWITGDEFRCRIEQALSDPRYITSGCKQGSCLGPLAFIIFINSLLKQLPKELTFCYADDLTIVIPYGKKNTLVDKNTAEVQANLDICSEWSDKTGLRFNTDKCYIIGIGRRHQMDSEFLLSNKTVVKPKDQTVTVLGINFTGGKCDYLIQTKKAAKLSGQLIFKRLKTLFKYTKFRHIIRLYYTYFTSKSLYGSEFFEDYTWQHGNYTKEAGWRKKLDSLYKRMLIGKLPTKGDLEKGKKKKFTEDFKLDAIPFMPSQIVLIKSLTLVFKIISGHLEKAGITLDNMKRSRNNDSTVFTRSQTLSALSKELRVNTKGTNNIITRHSDLIREMLDDEKYRDIEFANQNRQKHMIKKFVSGMESEENAIRKLISERKYRPAVVGQIGFVKRLEYHRK